MKKKLLDCRRFITSQCGEDGIIEEIFKRIGTENKICVEFGAYDGKTLSNTWELWHNRGWSAVLIESDETKFKKLKENIREFPQVMAFNTIVRPTGTSALDTILSGLHIPFNLDLISIDIDGDDYYILDNLNNFRPRVIAIEYNSTIAPELEIVQNPGGRLGASALALINLAKRKGYIFAGCTKTTCFFVINNEFHKIDMDEPDLKDIFPREDLRYVIISYDSQTYMNKDLWSYMPLKSIYSPMPVIFAFLRAVKNIFLKRLPADTQNILKPVNIFKEKLKK